MEQQVIQAFLVSLGYQVDVTSARKFLNLLQSNATMAAKASTAIAAVAIAAEVMVTKFTHNMERLYYASQRTKGSVANIQALEFGFTEIGLAADDAGRTLETFSRSLRLNPGLGALLNNLGIKTTGRDRVSVLLDFADKIGKMPPFIGAKYAQMFGLDPDTLLQMNNNQKQLIDAMERRLALGRRLGIDAQAGAEASKEYANRLRDLWVKFEVIGDGLALKLLPYFRQFLNVVNEIADDIVNIDLSKLDPRKLNFGEFSSDIHDLLSDFRELVALGKTWWDLLRDGVRDIANSDFGRFFIETIVKGLTNATHMLLALADAMINISKGDYGKAFSKLREAVSGGAGQRPGDGGGSPVSNGRITNSLINQIPGQVPTGGGQGTLSPSQFGGAPGSAVAGGGGAGGRQMYLSHLESMMGLPPGVLDSVWEQESHRGDPRYMVSSAGAKGHFGFMDKTAKQYGVNDPSNFEESASGSAHYIADLLKKYNGDLTMALSAYNWGPGNLDHKGLVNAPEETRKYAPSVLGRAGIHVDTHISVSGAGDPQSVATRVLAAQRQANADVVRDIGDQKLQ